MKIQIGRDIASSKLLLTADGKSVLSDKADVPASVSKEHCLIEIVDNTIKLQNLDINNYTYVNGMAVEAKTIRKTDRIELGRDRYTLDWKSLESLLPPVADIRPLKAVWENFETQNIALQIDERRFNTLRSVTGLITMVAIALSIASMPWPSWLRWCSSSRLIVMPQRCPTAVRSLPDSSSATMSVPIVAVF